MNKLTIKEFDKVDSMEWLLITSHSEGMNSDKVINDERLWNIGEWGNLKYIHAELDDKIVSRCLYCPENYFIYGLIVYPNSRNKGIGTKMIEHCYNIQNKLELTTSNPVMHHILNKLGFSNDGEINDEYSSGYTTVFKK